MDEVPTTRAQSTQEIDHAYFIREVLLIERGAVKLVQIAMVLMLLLAGSGCATSADLSKLNQRLTGNLEGYTKAVQMEMAGLRTQLAAQEKQQQEVIMALVNMKSTAVTDVDTFRRQLASFQCSS